MRMCLSQYIVVLSYRLSECSAQGPIEALCQAIAVGVVGAAQPTTNVTALKQVLGCTIIWRHGTSANYTYDHEGEFLSDQ